MLRTLQIAVGLIALAFNAAGITYFCLWFARTDWLFGHTQGPPAYIINAFWTASASIVGGVVWIAIAIYRRFRPTAEQKRASGKWLVVQVVVLVLLLIPTGLVVAVGLSKLPRARLRARTQHAESGAASVAELIEGLKSPDPYLRWKSADALAALGPRAKEAVPNLAAGLQDKDPNASWAAAKALAAIGPDAEPAIPALVAAVKRGAGLPSGVGRNESILPWLASEALAAIGPPAVPALVELLAHDDPYVRRRAANALGSMGPQAKDAVPSLAKAAEDADQDVSNAARRALERIEGKPAAPR